MSRRRHTPLTLCKLGIAATLGTIGVLLPWRGRIWYSEGLGWLAQLIPPRFTVVPDEEQDRDRP
jgi:hypothetical protein